MTYPHVLPVPPDWEHLNGEEKQSIRHYLTAHFTDAGNPLHRYRAYQAAIRQHNSEIAQAATLKQLAQAQPIIGVEEETGAPVYQNEDGTVTVAQATDEELTEILNRALQTIEDAAPRLARAIARKRFPETRPMDIRHATQNLDNAIRLIREDIEALSYTDEAQAARREREQTNRTWVEAARLYRARHRYGVPWHELTEEQRAEWFELADERVPPKWEDLTQKQRLVWAGGRDLPEDVVEPLYTRDRALKIRRKAYRKIHHAKPFTILSPQQRMADVAETAQTLSWARLENAKGRINDLTLAVWEEHYRRALHAYTKPFEPYPGAP